MAPSQCPIHSLCGLYASPDIDRGSSPGAVEEKQFSSGINFCRLHKVKDTMLLNLKRLEEFGYTRFKFYA